MREDLLGGAFLGIALMNSLKFVGLVIVERQILRDADLGYKSHF